MQQAGGLPVPEQNVPVERQRLDLARDHRDGDQSIAP
jgi:hypothetical protein